MVNSLGNAGPNTNNYAGMGIYCNNIDISKLSKDERDKFLEKMPTCTFVGPNGGQCYPAGYYMNNYANNNNTIKKRVTVLTDELIQSLDQSLDSERSDIRTSAANTIVKLFDEDITRHDDKALNVLLNKMLLNPYDKSVRGHALDLLNTQMAKGNEDTKVILESLQNDPTAIDRHRDEARLAMMNMAATTTVVNAPITNGGTIIS